MIKKKILLFPCLLLLFLSLTTFSFSEQRGTLEKIIISKGEKTLEVRILLRPSTYYRQFELSNPNRLVIDFLNTVSIKTSRHFKVNDFGVLAVRTGQFKPTIARVVFDAIDQIPHYKIEGTQEGVRVLMFLPGVEPEIPAEEITVEDAISNMRINPDKANLNDFISVDMSASQHAKSMEVEVFNEDGIMVASEKLTPESPLWQTKFDQPGEYVFKGKAFNIEGKPSKNPCEARTYINYPPVSQLECSPCKGHFRRPITLDASGSGDLDGEVVRVEFEIADKEGNLVDRFTDIERPFTWEKTFEKAGAYAVAAVVTDDFGAVSEPSRVDLVAKQKKFYFLIDAGSLAARGEGTYIIYATGRLGFLYKISPRRLDLIISGGGSYLSSEGFWNSFYELNMLFNYHAGPFFLGTGAGFTTGYKASRDYTYGEAIANAGFNVFNRYKTAGSIFFEGKGPISGISFVENYKVMLGLRFIF